ncbi:MAG: hypothetical protein NZ853_07100 [Leptospiraceae bacterium]|nr:hypothetical protein [Leptospiraceae bacterium]MDW7975800.1 hypothetical protein [Leptospiraceae bacterium]
MSSFFYGNNKYVISFNDEDLTKREIQDILKECELQEGISIILNFIDASDIKIKNLFSLILFIKEAKQRNIKIKLNIDEKLKSLLEKTSLIYKIT